MASRRLVAFLLAQGLKLLGVGFFADIGAEHHDIDVLGKSRY